MANTKIDFREKELYHQIHPLKLATDIGVTPISLFFLWRHQITPAIIVGFVPPVIVSVAMMLWPPDLKRLKNSAMAFLMSNGCTAVGGMDLKWKFL